MCVGRDRDGFLPRVLMDMTEIFAKSCFVIMFMVNGALQIELNGTSIPNIVLNV